MPAHITHEIFAREVFERAAIRLGIERLTDQYFVFGAQGPDFCLHSYRTKPTGLIFGQLLHGQGYGEFVQYLVEYGRRIGKTFSSPFGAFTAAFTTHAVLDRITHPFINYFSGWVSPKHPESDRYQSSHAFFERIIDVFVLRIRREQTIGGYDFFSHVDCGTTMPHDLSESISQGIVATFPEYSNPRNVQRRVENAYFDTRNFYAYTNPPERRNVQNGNTSLRLLALLHPDRLPDLDYLNAAHAKWNHPGIADEVHTESFFDLYEQALDTAVVVVKAVDDAFEGRMSGRELAEAIGNENLSDGRTTKAGRRLAIVRPLPLREVLATIYSD